MSMYASVLKMVKDNPNKTAQELASLEGMSKDSVAVNKVLPMLVADGRVTKDGADNSFTFTVTVASPAVFSKTAHGLAAGQAFTPTTTGALPTGLTPGVEYYVIAAGLTADAFKVSATRGGAAVNTSGTQSGTHTGAGAATYSSTSEQ